MIRLSSAILARFAVGFMLLDLQFLVLIILRESHMESAALRPIRPHALCYLEILTNTRARVQLDSRLALTALYCNNALYDRTSRQPSPQWKRAVQLLTEKGAVVTAEKLLQIYQIDELANALKASSLEEVPVSREQD
jgi:hypothetical protein